jgi:hypothetical protein
MFESDVVSSDALEALCLAPRAFCLLIVACMKLVYMDKLDVANDVELSNSHL